MPRPLQKLIALAQGAGAVLNIPEDLGASAQNTKVLVRYGAGTSAGSIVVEESHDPSYSGTWVNVSTIAWAAADKEHSVAIVGNFMAMRIRVASITGGTADLYALVNG